MPIDTLEDIRSLVAGYVPGNVTVSVVGPDPDVGDEVGPNEGFKYTLRATNNGEVQITNVIWHVFMSPFNTTQLVVPGGPLASRSDPDESLPTLNPGDLVQELYIYPQFGKKVLEPGETDEIRLKGMATSNPSGEVAAIQFKLIGSVDHSYLFPTDAHAGPASLGINITG